MPLTGWSMTKSILNAFTGILVKKGKLKLSDNSLIPGWNLPNDPRKNITLGDILRMITGLSFQEKYLPFFDATTMLFSSNSTAHYASLKHLHFNPGTHWSYSSGTSNLLSYIIRQSVGGTLEDYYQFMHQELFSKLKMNSIIMEPDPNGTFVGSSFSWATARDWARFGLLYQQDGIWNGERILPEKWVNFTRTPIAVSGNGYGGHFWLNANTLKKRFPNVPSNIYYSSGFCGQFVIVFPTEDLVFVRLGQDIIEESQVPYIENVVNKVIKSKLLRGRE